jgi:hypothetical protein
MTTIAVTKQIKRNIKKINIQIKENSDRNFLNKTNLFLGDV